jgi:hypothetical protein
VGSIPDEVIEFFNWPNPSSHTMALGSTQPLTEISIFFNFTAMLPATLALSAVEVHLLKQNPKSIFRSVLDIYF